MSQLPITSTPTTKNVTVPPEMWKKIQKMLSTYQEPVSTGSPAQLSVSHVNQKHTLLSPAPASPARTLPNENEHPGPKSNSKTSSHNEVLITNIDPENRNNDKISKSHSSSGENLGTGELVEENTNSRLVTDLTSYNFRIGGIFSCFLDPK